MHPINHVLNKSGKSLGVYNELVRDENHFKAHRGKKGPARHGCLEKRQTNEKYQDRCVPKFIFVVMILCDIGSIVHLMINTVFSKCIPYGEYDPDE